MNTKNAKKSPSKDKSKKDKSKSKPKEEKKGTTGYMVYGKEERARAKKSDPEAKISFKDIGAGWASLTESEKEVYNQKAAKENDLNGIVKVDKKSKVSSHDDKKDEKKVEKKDDKKGDKKVDKKEEKKVDKKDEKKGLAKPDNSKAKGGKDTGKGKKKKDESESEDEDD